MSFSKHSLATITKSVFCLNHIHRSAISSPFSLYAETTTIVTLGFELSAHYLINITDPAAPTPNVKSCNVYLCMILFTTL